MFLVENLGDGFIFRGDLKQQQTLDQLKIDKRKKKKDSHFKTYISKSMDQNAQRKTCFLHRLGRLNSSHSHALIQAMKFQFGLLGDSSLYTKRRNKKKTKTYISQALRPMLPGKQLKDETSAGGGVEEFNTYVDSSGHDFEILKKNCYFGNDHTEHPMNEVKHLEKWKTLFGLLRQHVKKRVVFFVGGYAAKYGYGQAYDNNMKIIRRWIRDVGGFECRTDFDKVSTWPLAADKLHFDVACLGELAEYWKQLFIGDQTEFTEAPIKRKRCCDEMADERFGKRARSSHDCTQQTDGWKDCILALPHEQFYS